MKPSIRRAVIEARRANPDRPISTCYWDARRREHFMEQLRADIAQHKRRSAAAKKARKTRKAQVKA